MWVYCSVSVCTGVLVRFGWSRVVSGCRLEHVVNSILIRNPFPVFLLSPSFSFGALFKSILYLASPSICSGDKRIVTLELLLCAIVIFLI